MPLRIFNNLSSAIAQNRLDVNNLNLGEAIGRIASGDRDTNGSLAFDATTGYIGVVVGLDSAESGQIDINETASIGSTDTTSLELDSLSVASFEDAVNGLVRLTRH